MQLFLKDPVTAHLQVNFNEFGCYIIFYKDPNFTNCTASFFPAN